MIGPMDPSERRQGDRYLVTDDDRRRFREDGWLHLRGLLSEEELSPIEVVYERFIRGTIPVEGRDFCDMSGDYEQAPEDFSIINVMLPRRYFPEWQGNLYERRARSVAEQLCGPDMALDYDQLLAKPPGKADAVFHWHQDLAYWIDTPDTRTASFWLPLDDVTRESGCMRFVSGSHLEPELRGHHPLLNDRDESHTLVSTTGEEDAVVHAEIGRGDCTVHHERVLHGSGGNESDRWRRAYVVAYRARATVALERELGFTHSHNDPPEVLARVEAMKRR